MTSVSKRKEPLIQLLQRSKDESPAWRHHTIMSLNRTTMNHCPQLPKLHNSPSLHMVATVLDRLLIDSASVDYSAYKDRNRD